jgi:DNA-binding XRE family transcriptional regulator
MSACTDLRLTGGQLRQLRGALGMRQEELSGLTFVSRATISIYEAQAGRPLPDTLASRTLTSVLLGDPRVRVDENGIIHVRILPAE